MVRDGEAHTERRGHCFAGDHRDGDFVKRGDVE